MQEPTASSVAILSELYHKYFGSRPEEIVLLPQSGSVRKYYRLTTGAVSAIGTFGNNQAENEAFFSFTHHFNIKRQPVPQLYSIHTDRQHYLQEDIGNDSLYSRLPESGADFSLELKEIYREVLKTLAVLQIEGGQGLDYSAAFPRAEFDAQSMRWDCNYFKYYFLNLMEIPYDEEQLEQDFMVLTKYLLKADSSHFLFRDFQSRNIFLKDNKAYFIDYQGGRRGALAYDVTSLLYQAKADIPQRIREELLEEYIKTAKGLTDLNPIDFREQFYAFTLLRQMQVLGAYGRRGLVERKAHFLKSIPFALKNIAWILEHKFPPVSVPELHRVLGRLTKLKSYDL